MGKKGGASYKELRRPLKRNFDRAMGRLMLLIRTLQSFNRVF